MGALRPITNAKKLRYKKVGVQRQANQGVYLATNFVPIAPFFCRNNKETALKRPNPTPPVRSGRVRAAKPYTSQFSQCGLGLWAPAQTALPTVNSQTQSKSRNTQMGTPTKAKNRNGCSFGIKTTNLIQPLASVRRLSTLVQFGPTVGPVWNLPSKNLTPSTYSGVAN